MHATIAALLDERALGLRLVTGEPDALRRPVEWATATEHIDPTPFLTSGQLVLTTGLRMRSARLQRSFVAAIAAAGSVGLGFGVGFTHQQVPPALVTAANEAGLPIVEVPLEMSFESLIRFVSDAQAKAQFAQLETRQRGQQQLFAAMIGERDGGGLHGLVAQLARSTGAYVAISRYGDVLAGSLDIDDDRVTGWEVLPVAATTTTQATLHVSNPHTGDDLLNVARSLVSLHLAGESQRIRDSRSAAGQVVTDLVQGRLDAENAAIRLGSIGHPEGGRTRVLIVEGTGPRASEVLDLPLPARLDHVVGAIVADRLAVLLPAREPARESALAILANARAAGLGVRVGIGDAYPGPRNLRWSYFEALDSIAGLGEGADIGEQSRLSMSALILASRDTPVHELAETLLAPLDRSDRETGTALIATLDAFLRRSGAVAQVADELGTHRNTVRYRIDQILQLTGFDARVTADAVQLWLALAARRIGG